MTQLLVEVTDEFTIQVDVPPGVRPSGMTFDFVGRSDPELRRLVALLGYEPLTMDPTKRLHVRWGVPVTCDGERVAKCNVNLWIGEEYAPAPDPPPIEGLARLRAEAAAAAGKASWGGAHGVAGE